VNIFQLTHDLYQYYLSEAISCFFSTTLIKYFTQCLITVNMLPSTSTPATSHGSWTMSTSKTGLPNLAVRRQNTLPSLRVLPLFGSAHTNLDTAVEARPIVQWHKHLNRGRLVLGRAHAPVPGPLCAGDPSWNTVSVYDIPSLIWPRICSWDLTTLQKVANLRWAKLYTTTQPPAVVGIKLTYDGPTPNHRRLDTAPGGWWVHLTYDGLCPPS
jgi:hypothetical protein